jgi:hypothetical protein
MRAFTGSADAEIGFKSSFGVTGDAEGPHVLDRENYLSRFDWLDNLHVSRQF